MFKLDSEYLRLSPRSLIIIAYRFIGVHLIISCRNNWWAKERTARNAPATAILLFASQGHALGELGDAPSIRRVSQKNGLYVCMPNFSPADGTSRNYRYFPPPNSWSAYRLRHLLIWMPGARARARDIDAAPTPAPRLTSKAIAIDLCRPELLNRVIQVSTLHCGQISARRAERRIRSTWNPEIPLVRTIRTMRVMVKSAPGYALYCALSVENCCEHKCRGYSRRGSACAIQSKTEN